MTRQASSYYTKLVAAVVIILTIVVAFTLFAAWRLHEYNERYISVPTPRRTITEIYDSVKTGDIILFVSAVHHPSNSIVTGTFFSHIGVVIRDAAGLCFLSESHPGSAVMPGKPRFSRYGADLTPLLPRLKHYTGICYWMPLSRALDADRDAALRRAASAALASRHPYPSMAQAIFGLVGWRSTPRHCFQHVAHLLDEAGLGGTDHRWTDFGVAQVCREMCGLPGTLLRDGYRYLAPIQILYDVADDQSVDTPNRGVPFDTSDHTASTADLPANKSSVKNPASPLDTTFLVMAMHSRRAS